MRFWVLALAIWTPCATFADTVLALRTIRPEEIISSSDIRIVSETVLGSYSHADEVVGQEARVALYPGRPIRRGDVRAPALVGRNDKIELIFRKGGLEITAEGRALSRAAVGEPVLALNTGSRRRVTGAVLPDGRVLVE